MILLLSQLSLWCAEAAFIAIIIKILLIAMFIFSIIGFITTIKFLFFRKKYKNKEDEWIKTGKF